MIEQDFLYISDNGQIFTLCTHDTSTQPKQLIEKSMECHIHKLQPNTKRKRKILRTLAIILQKS